MPPPARLPLGAALVAVLVSACILGSPVLVHGLEHDSRLVKGVAIADLSITKSDFFDPVIAGFDIAYTITVNSSGPDVAADVSWSDTLPGPTTFTSLTAPGGWSCTTPAVGTGGTVSCSIASLPVGSAVFSLAVGIPPATVPGTVLSNMVTVSSTTSDPDGDDLSATETTTVSSLANLQASKVGAPDPVTPGTNLTYTLTVHNGGPSNAADVELSDLLPTGTTFVSLASPAGWSCVTPAVGAGGWLECSIASVPPGDFVFALVVNVGSGVVPGTSLLNRGTILTTTPPAVPFSSIFSTSTTVGSSIADISLTKTASPDPVSAGASIIYTLTVGNAGPSNAPFATLSDTLPAGTTFVSLSSPPGWFCVPPAVGAGGTVSCTPGSFGLGNAVFTLVVQVDPATPDGTVISNSASLTSVLPASDPNPGDTNPTADTTVASGGSEIVAIPVLDWRGLVALTALLAALGAGWLRRG